MLRWFVRFGVLLLHDDEHKTHSSVFRGPPRGLLHQINAHVEGSQVLLSWGIDIHIKGRHEKVRGCWSLGFRGTPTSPFMSYTTFVFGFPLTTAAPLVLRAPYLDPKP